uniref:NADH-ubiquinone oxidoreductase chain 2 n=1 Tax=Pterobdella arugamensis TaxID=3410361 RepID=A0A343B6X2_9ANNE|nr:NADH dehydrogenase subunit 2 [Zeylanicobdella arugamensis]AQT26255.1 NADH dehydrogenase subunit 2 [Zeylanicobdella arugamensis]
MYLSPVNMLMMLVLMLSSLMAISSSNWFFIWFSMELNMLSFIPILLYNNKIMEIEASIKYLITQSIASSMLLMSSMMLWNNTMNLMLFYYMLCMSLLMKLGSFPCYYWFPSVMASISWINCMVLSTWQKIIPIFIMFSMINLENKMIIMICLLNLLIGGIFGMKSSNMKIIMAYSSISHLGWMLLIKLVNMVSLLYFYFLSYIMMILPLFNMFNKLKINNFNSISMMNKINMTSILMLSLMILSMAGLPPFTGFFLKLIVIYSVLKINITYLILIIIVSILSLYFYLNISYNMLLNSYMNNNDMMKFKFNKVFSILSIFLYTPMIMML